MDGGVACPLTDPARNSAACLPRKNPIGSSRDGATTLICNPAIDAAVLNNNTGIVAADKTTVGDAAHGDAAAAVEGNPIVIPLDRSAAFVGEDSESCWCC